MKSMTGYGQATIELADCQVSIEISSVNKKGLEFVLQAPKEWQAFERTVQNLVRQKVDRGRIRLTLSVDTSHNKSTHNLWNMEAMDGELDKYPEAAFNLVGSIEEAIEKGDKMLAEAK